jgi:serine/threonine-protein kinase
MQSSDRKFVPGTKPDKLSDGFGQAVHVAVDAAADVYVTDYGTNQVPKLTPGATNPIPLPFNGLEQPGDLGVDDRGNVYVFDEMNFRALKIPVH